MATTKEPFGKILVVDDEVELKNALVEMLLNQSYDVRGYVNVYEALEAVRREAFDLMITDLMMPEMDGIALIKAALEIDPNLVPIIMTGSASNDTAAEAKRVGAFDYVLKPFRLKMLMPILTRAMQTRRLGEESRSSAEPGIADNA
jgi:DNA-binding NtrC family response regulator